MSEISDPLEVWDRTQATQRGMYFKLSTISASVFLAPYTAHPNELGRSVRKFPPASEGSRDHSGRSQARGTAYSPLHVSDDDASNATFAIAKLSAYKSAFSASSKEAEEHARIVTSLRQSLADSAVSHLHRSFLAVDTDPTAQNHNGCSVAVIDGDGYPFAPEFLRGGRGGGQKAATALKAKLVAATSPDEQILIFVYLNRLGMTEHLLANNLLKRAHDFDDFIRGFNQASPLFHIIDVGHGKEAADAKIRGIATPLGFATVLP